MKLEEKSKKLAIVSSHPIQYNAPLFKLLNEKQQFHIKVFYTWGQTEFKMYDPDFGREIKWDIQLLEGYEYKFVTNIAKDPGFHHFNGIINPTLLTEVEDYNPNFILIFGWSFNSHLKLIRHFKDKIKILFRGDSTFIDEQPLIRKILRKYFLSWVYRYVDIALYVGYHNRLYYLRCGLKKNQLVFAPHAIDNDRFANEDKTYEQRASEYRRSMGILPDEKVFLFAGKLETKKNPGLLLECFNELKAPDCHLMIVGNGILEKELKEKYSGSTFIHFWDFQNQSFMPVLYRMCDVFVLPSQGPFETWGLSVNEAMACSRAVLVSDKCGCAVDLVSEGNNGYIFKSNEKTNLIEKMGILIADKPRLIMMGKNSQEMIKKWSYEKTAKVLISTLNSFNN